MLREWKFRHCRPVFSAWSAVCTEKRALLRRALGRLSNRLLGLTFGAWLGALRTSKLQRGAAEAAAFRLMHRHVAASFVAWRDEVRAALEARRAQLQRAAARMVHRHLAATFFPWSELAARLVAARRSAAERGAACGRRSVRAHMRAWAAQRREQERAREVAVQRGLYGVAQASFWSASGAAASASAAEGLDSAAEGSGSAGLATAQGLLRCDASRCLTRAAAARTLVEWRRVARASAEQRAQLDRKACVLGARRTLLALFYRWSAAPRQRLGLGLG